MKKLVSLIFTLLVVMLPITANAAGAISTDEQRILDSLNAGITTKEGQRFFFSATDIQQAENDLKTNDYSAETVNTVVGHIEAAKQLAVDNSAGIKATGLEDFLKQLPKHIQNQIQNHILEAAKALGLSVDSKGNVTNNAGQKVFVATTSSNPVVKTTGISLTSAIVTIASLVALTVATGFFSKRRGASC
ncbi:MULTISPECIES: hypothetical protein [unclassified Vagococcus]|nr:MULTISPECIES: hypothetical protein [unclassified Vagococcus]MCI0131089.1 hypothetical protein [Vagococcus sp. CY53-2]UNM89687.1 hypothetical protein MN187_00915 [Vagococcus sp. CY52-2]